MKKPGYIIAFTTLCGVLAGTGQALASEGGSTGFPQLDPSTYASQVFWLTVAFVALYVLMSRTALPRIGEVLDTRETTRENDLSRAESLQTEAEDVKAAYDQALAKAHDEAQSFIAETTASLAEKAAQENAAFAEKARERIQKAEQNIQKAKEEAMSSIADVAATIAADAARKITTGSVTAAQAKKAVTVVMKETR